MVLEETALCEKDNAMTLKQSEEIAFRNLSTRYTMHEVLCPSEDNEISQSAAVQAASKRELNQQEAGSHQVGKVWKWTWHCCRTRC